MRIDQLSSEKQAALDDWEQYKQDFYDQHGDDWEDHKDEYFDKHSDVTDQVNNLQNQIDKLSQSQADLKKSAWDREGEKYNEGEYTRVHNGAPQVGADIRGQRGARGRTWRNADKNETTKNFVQNPDGSWRKVTHADREQAVAQTLYLAGEAAMPAAHAGDTVNAAAGVVATIPVFQIAVPAAVNYYIQHPAQCNEFVRGFVGGLPSATTSKAEAAGMATREVHDRLTQ